METVANSSPIKNFSDLPVTVKHVLPEHGQKIYFHAFNSAWDEYKDVSKRKGSESREVVAHKVAWNAIERKYHKNAASEKWKLFEKHSN